MSDSTFIDRRPAARVIRWWAICLALVIANAWGDAHSLPHAFESALADVVARSGVVGGVAAYVLPGGDVHTFATGLADREDKRPMSSRDRMLAGSVGKSFVGALALGLAADGLIDLDAPVSRHLGHLKWFERLPNGSDITLRHLLDHSAGLLDHVYLPEFAEMVASGQNPGRAQAIGLVLDRDPLFPAGQGFAYTDTGYLLAGMVIEAATGATYYGELRRRILDPLALTRTSPSDHRRLPGLVPGYLSPDNPMGLPTKTLLGDGRFAFDPSGEWTGGGLISNARDLARWGYLYYRGQAFDADYLDDLLGGGYHPPGQPARYSLGTGIAMTDFGVSYGHSGWFPGYQSFMAYFPDHQVAIAVQFNSSFGEAAGEDPVELAKRILPAVVIEHVQ